MKWWERILMGEGLGQEVETDYNAFDEPTQVTAFSNGSLPNQVTDYQYDFGMNPPVWGKLTRARSALGQPEQEVSLFGYLSPDAPDAPTFASNPVLGVSSIDYEAGTGRPSEARSPANFSLLSQGASPDAYPSQTTVSYYETGPNMGLVASETDALGNVTSYRYSGDADPSRLVTTTTLPDGSTTSTTTDSAGRVVKAIDELGIETDWTYNREGRPLTVTEAAGTVDQRTTTSAYTVQGDLASIVVSGQGGGSYAFDYERRDQTGNLVLSGGSSIYEGRLTQVTYPDGSQETYGYVAPPDTMTHHYFIPDDAAATRNDGDLHWIRKRDGGLILLARDPQHRVVEERYLKADGVTTAFTLDPVYDEFGRVSQEMDALGTTTYAYDSLNRETGASFTPTGGMAPTKTWGYSYTLDYRNQRRLATETPPRPIRGGGIDALRGEIVRRKAEKRHHRDRSGTEGLMLLDAAPILREGSSQANITGRAGAATGTTPLGQPIR